MILSRRGVVLLFSVLIFSIILNKALAAEPLPGFVMDGTLIEQINSRVSSQSTTTFSAPAATTGVGDSCSNIDFEGVGDLSAIPTFDGIASPNWLGLIDFDAGGSGNFAYEPSPSTIAFWLGGATGTGSSRDIVFQDAPVKKVSFYFASFVNIQVKAYNAAGDIVASAVGTANWNQGPGGDPNGNFNKWDPISVESAKNDIVKINVTGAVNQTGIDNLEVCRGISISSIEFTQAIQDLQTVDELTADLAADGEPPVPIVAGKPGYMRLYFEEVQTTTELDITSVLNGVSVTSRVTVQPGCTPAQQRDGVSGCQSYDRYFLPPSGSWDAEIEVKDTTGIILEQHSFTIKSRDAEPLVLGAVKVCDTRNSSGAWQCADNYKLRLDALVPLLRKIAPTHSVTVVDTNETVRRDISTINVDSNGNGVIDQGPPDWEDAPWWNFVTRDVDSYFGLFDLARDALGLEDRRYFGIARTAVGMQTVILGKASGIPSRGAVSLSTAFDRGVDVSADTVAHETGHMLGRRHTNTDIPMADCSLAGDPQPNWPYSDNRLRSGSGANTVVETGFDVATRSPVPGATNYEIMSYCIPVWISSFTYNGILINALDKPFTAAATTSTAELGEYWLISGVIDETKAVLDPLYQLSTFGTADSQTGTHAIDLVDANGNVLFTRFFTPIAPEARVSNGNGEPPSQATFSQLIPVDTSAVRIVVRNLDGQTLAEKVLGGAPPVVTIAFPTGGEDLSGINTISWFSSDADGGTPRYWVQYSADNGASGKWQTLGKDLIDPSLTIDFDSIPGTSGRSRIRVLATDGTNASSSISAAFSVAKKPPTAKILFPDKGHVFRKNDLVYLQGSGNDAEDGNLDHIGMHWSSNLDGDLGNGETLPIANLKPGKHILTLSATDKDNNVSLDRVDVVIADQGPNLDLLVEPLDSLPTTCVRVTMNGEAGSVPLSKSDYSLDGGETYTEVPVGALPHSFIVPGSGFFHLIARVFDVSGQAEVKDQRFFTDAPCANANEPPVANAGEDQTVECALPGGAMVTLDGSGSSDPDGDPLTYTWSGSFGTVNGVSPTVQLPLGTHTINLLVEDGNGGQSNDQVNITVGDATPPQINLIDASPSLLWPPDHTMRPVSVNVEATDICDVEPTCSLTSVLSNESNNAQGDGNTEVDIIVDGFSLQLRAERSGRGDQRVYSINTQCTDKSGNSSSAMSSVIVPHSAADF